jgi:hypothetical protein
VKDLDRQVLAGLTEQFGALLLEYDAGSVMGVDDLLALFEVEVLGYKHDLFVEVVDYCF